jgi:hypothetical protein
MGFLAPPLKTFEMKIYGLLPFGGRSYLFFVIRSLKNWIFIAKSAYIILRRECSSSTFFSFYTSDTSTPPNLAHHFYKVDRAITFSRPDPVGFAGFMILKRLNELNFGES